MKLKCPKCEHEWNYRGEMLMATCPSCYAKVKIVENKIEDGE